MTSSSVLLSIISIFYSFAVGYILFPSVSDYMEPFQKACFSSALRHDSDLFLGVGLDPIDRILCFGSAFFKGVVEHSLDLGKPSLYFVSGPLLASFIFTSVESLRKGSRAFTFWVPLVYVVGQVVSIAVAFPLLWLPSYFMGSNRLKKQTIHNRVGLINSADGMLFVAFSIWFFGCNYLDTHPLSNTFP